MPKLAHNTIKNLSENPFEKAGNHPFVFDTYDFNYQTLTAEFRYIGPTDITFCETVHFANPNKILGRPTKFKTKKGDRITAWPELPLEDRDFVWLLDSALKLAFYLIGISYYKADPTTSVISSGLDEAQAKFFSIVYQDGLSQFACTNHLSRKDLATFTPDPPARLEVYESFKRRELDGRSAPKLTDFSDSVLILQSGGKDSLLAATLNKDVPHTFWHLSSSTRYPALLKNLDSKIQIATRVLDRGSLVAASGMNGHIPVTYVTMALALVQAILNRQKTVFTSIGQEGNEPHSASGDLLVNHQWSKTYEAEQLFRDYVHTYISPELDVRSPLRDFTELKISKLFAEKCWERYGHRFSSCNVANYRQGANDQELHWCGNCPKCANAYVLFSPYVPRKELDSLFGGRSLYKNPKLFDIFKGLFGLEGYRKPFECVGETDELRFAYYHRLPEYPDLPFEVPKAEFDLNRPDPQIRYLENPFKNTATKPSELKKPKTAGHPRETLPNPKTTGHPRETLPNSKEAS